MEGLQLYNNLDYVLPNKMEKEPHQMCIFFTRMKAQNSPISDSEAYSSFQAMCTQSQSRKRAILVKPMQHKYGDNRWHLPFNDTPTATKLVLVINNI